MRSKITETFGILKTKIYTTISIFVCPQIHFNMRSFFLLIFMALSLIVNAQSEITNSKTTKHINIQGTQTFIIPPEGFEKASNFVGFQQNTTGASIMILEMPGPYIEFKKGFTKENLAQKGMNLLNAEEFIINNQPAILIFVTQFSSGHGYMFQKYNLLLKQTESKTLLINLNFPESLKDELQEKMKNSALSVYVDTLIGIDPFATLDFTVDLSKSTFTLKNSISGTLMLEGPDKEIFILAKSIKAADGSDKKGAAIKSLKEISSLEYLELISSKEVTIDGASGIQIVANVTSKPEDEKMNAFLTMLFGENYYYIFLGVVSPNDTTLMQDMEYVISTFQRK